MFKKIRIHNQYYEYGRLRTWSLARCVCGKFLGKHRRFCDTCKKLARKATESKRYSIRKEEALLRNRVRNNPDQFNIGDII